MGGFRLAHYHYEIMKEVTNTIKWEVGGRRIQDDDAGTWRFDDYTGFRYNAEDLVLDEHGLWVHPDNMYDPAPTEGHGFSSENPLAIDLPTLQGYGSGLYGDGLYGQTV